MGRRLGMRRFRRVVASGPRGVFAESCFHLSQTPVASVVRILPIGCWRLPLVRNQRYTARRFVLVFLFRCVNRGNAPSGKSACRGRPGVREGEASDERRATVAEFRVAVTAASSVCCIGTACGSRSFLSAGGEAGQKSVQSLSSPSASRSTSSKLTLARLSSAITRRAFHRWLPQAEIFEFLQLT